MRRTAELKVAATVTIDRLQDVLTELSPAALSAAGLSVDEVVAAETARVDLNAGTLSVTRAGGNHHLTASCLLLAARGSTWSVALALHTASGQWRQFGGHLEPADRTLRDAAVRELMEESSLDAEAAGAWVSSTPIAIREFSVGTASCQTHLDVLFAATADSTRPLATADGGITDAEWWNADDLPSGAASDLTRDLPLLLRRVERLMPT